LNLREKRGRPVSELMTKRKTDLRKRTRLTSLLRPNTDLIPMIYNPFEHPMILHSTGHLLEPSLANGIEVGRLISLATSENSFEERVVGSST